MTDRYNLDEDKVRLFCAKYVGKERGPVLRFIWKCERELSFTGREHEDHLMVAKIYAFLKKKNMRMQDNNINLADIYDQIVHAENQLKRSNGIRFRRFVSKNHRVKPRPRDCWWRPG